MASSDILYKIDLLEYKQEFLEKELHLHREEISGLKKSLKNNLHNAPTHTPKKAPQLTPKTTPLNPSAPPLATGKPKPNKPPKTPKPVAPKKDLQTRELDFGKVWFVRLGIISLITGLVFLSNFAYQNFIYTWGPAPRLTGLYLLAAIMLGIGTYFETAKAAISNYGKVLAAGAIATLYYTSYAAHYIDRLRVIDSPLLGGILLILSAAACLVYALWKKSTTTAIFSIVLAFYSTSINPVGGFTLISGLILTLSGVTLLDKLRQSAIGFTTMLGAYLSFIYWQLLVNQGAGYQHASWFVLAYWILCTAVVLKQRIQSKPFFSEKQLLTYTSLNNSFFIFLTSINFSTMQFHSSLWLNIATIGVSFTALSLYLYQKKNNPSLPNTLAHLFLGKGFALIALALCIKLSGTSLAISLTIQASLALIAGTYSQRKLLLHAGYLALILGFGIYATAIVEAGTIRHSIMLSIYAALAVFLHLKPQLERVQFKLLESFPPLFATITLCSLIATADITIFTKIILSLTTFTILRTLKGNSIYRYIPTPLYHLSHLIAGLAIYLVISSPSLLYNFTQIRIITILLFALAAVQAYGKLHWDESKKGIHFCGFYNTIATIMLLLNLTSFSQIHLPMLFISLLPITYHLLYNKVKLPSIPAIGLLCYIISWTMTAITFTAPKIESNLLIQLLSSLTPLLHYYLMQHGKLCHLGKLSHQYLQKTTSTILIIASAVMITLWQYQHLQFWELTLAITATLFYWINDRKNLRTFSLCALGIYATALLSVLFTPQQSYILRYLVILTPLFTYFLNQIKPTQPYLTELNRSIAITFSLTLWFIASQHTIAATGSSALSICWALIGLAILCLGFLTRDIVFRTMAFIILAATILHVYGVDVWKITALFRILSFITLGIVLLIIGYLYSRKVDNHEKNNLTPKK